MTAPYVIPIAAYLLGSIPFGYLLVRYSSGIDIRTQGSGNIGATNVFRKNRAAGILTLILDAAKGYAAVTLASWLAQDSSWHTVAALCAILGHVFPVFLAFKGGKGVATACGAFFAILPAVTLTALIVFLGTVAATRYVSLGSMIACGTFPLLTYYGVRSPELAFWASVASVLIITRHHANIRRLLAGTEQKLAFDSRKQ